MVPVLCLKNTFSPSPDNRWGGGSKNRTSLPIAHGPYIQAHLAEASGTLGTFLVPAGEGGGVLGSITREVGPWGNHSASGYFSLHLGPCFLLGPISDAQSNISATSPCLAQPPTSILTSENPLVPGDSVRSSRF